MFVHPSSIPFLQPQRIPRALNVPRSTSRLTFSLVDPWFNFRATKYLVTNGFYSFCDWFDDRKMALQYTVYHIKAAADMWNAQEHGILLGELQEERCILASWLPVVLSTISCDFCLCLSTSEISVSS